MSEYSERNETRRGAALEVHSIALALDCSTLNRAALETAVALAAATHARLRAVFVENRNLFDLAELPGACQVSGSGRETRVIDARAMHDAMATACQAARRAVSDAAGRARVEWAFDTVRGVLDETLARFGAECEIVALGCSQANIGRVHQVAVLRRTLRNGTGVIVAPTRLSASPGPILALVGPGADPGRIVRTTESIAERSGRPHRFAVLASTAAKRDELAGEVAALLGRPAPMSAADSQSLAAVTWSVRRNRAGLVIADIDYACFDEATSVERIAEAFGCPLLLVQV